MAQVISQEDIKKAVQAYMTEHPGYFKVLIKEILIENPELLTEHLDRDKRVDKLIDTHFERFDDVFKALA